MGKKFNRLAHKIELFYEKKGKGQGTSKRRPDLRGPLNFDA